MESIAQRLRMPPPELRFERTSDAIVAATALDVALVSDLAGLAALGPQWSALFARVGQPHQVFQTFEWLWTWSRIYSDHRTRLAIITGHVDGKLALVWPLVVTRRLGLRILTFMGDPVSQYGDAILDPALSETDQDVAFEAMMRLPVDVRSFRRVRADAALAPLLRRRLGAPLSVQHAPFVDFAGVSDVASLEKRWSGKVRSGQRRHLRRLAEQGPVRFAHHDASPEASALIAVAVGFKQDWARRAGVVAPAIADPRFARFFAAAASGQPHCPALRVSALSCGEDIVGVEISVACKGRLFGHVLAPRPGLEKQGVGGILAGSAITSALEQGFSAYDTLAPADAYKRQWTTTSVAVGDHASGRGLRGILYVRLWLAFGRAATKRIMKRLRRANRRPQP